MNYRSRSRTPPPRSAPTVPPRIRQSARICEICQLNVASLHLRRVRVFPDPCPQCHRVEALMSCSQSLRCNYCSYHVPYPRMGGMFLSPITLFPGEGEEGN